MEAVGDVERIGAVDELQPAVFARVVSLTVPSAKRQPNVFWLTRSGEVPRGISRVIRGSARLPLAWRGSIIDVHVLDLLARFTLGIGVFIGSVSPVVSKTFGEAVHGVRHGAFLALEGVDVSLGHRARAVAE